MTVSAVTLGQSISARRARVLLTKGPRSTNRLVSYDDTAPIVKKVIGQTTITVATGGFLYHLDLSNHLNGSHKPSLTVSALTPTGSTEIKPDLEAIQDMVRILQEQLQPTDFEELKDQLPELLLSIQNGAENK